MTTVAVVAAPNAPERPLIQEITLSSIKPSKANPRRHMDETALAELAANIKTHGVLQPILIRPVTEGAYEIVCGERRWRAGLPGLREGPDTGPHRNRAGTYRTDSVSARRPHAKYPSGGHEKPSETRESGPRVRR